MYIYHSKYIRFHAKYIPRGCFDEVRGDVIGFWILQGFLQIIAEKRGLVAKTSQLTSQTLDADLMVRSDRWQTHHQH